MRPAVARRIFLQQMSFFLCSAFYDLVAFYD